jgi:DNA-binding transcriptional LysR family regulator
MDRLLANQLFCRVLELGSFSAAAREVRLPQPTVSRLIAALEEALETRLLERTTRRVAPTLEGRAYYAHVEEAVRTLQHAEAAARSGFAEVAGHVKIAVPGALGRKLLLPRLVALLLESPELRIDISASDQPVDFVAGGFDFAIRVGVQKNSSFVARELAVSTQWLVGSPRYLAMRGTPSSSAELRGHHLVLRGEPQPQLRTLALVTRMSTDACRRRALDPTALARFHRRTSRPPDARLAGRRARRRAHHRYVPLGQAAAQSLSSTAGALELGHRACFGGEHVRVARESRTVASSTTAGSAFGRRLRSRIAGTASVVGSHET